MALVIVVVAAAYLAAVLLEYRGVWKEGANPDKWVYGIILAMSFAVIVLNLFKPEWVQPGKWIEAAVYAVFPGAKQ